MPDDELNITELLADKTNNISKFLEEMFDVTDIPSASNTPNPNPSEIDEDFGQFQAFLKSDKGKNTWILSVVSVEFGKKMARKPKYLRSFILYNLLDGSIIPCLMKTTPKKAKNGICTTITPPADLNPEEIHIINTEGFYYNISNDNVGKIFNGKTFSDYFKSNNSTKHEYKKSNKLLPIQLGALNSIVNGNPKGGFIEAIQRDVHRILVKNRSLSYDKIYDNEKTKMGEQKPHKIPSLLKYSDTIKLTTSGQLFWKKASNEVNSINSSGVRINRAKRTTTESVITENTGLPNLKNRISSGLWISNFKITS